MLDIVHMYHFTWQVDKVRWLGRSRFMSLYVYTSLKFLIIYHKPLLLIKPVCENKHIYINNLLKQKKNSCHKHLLLFCGCFRAILTNFKLFVLNVNCKVRLNFYMDKNRIKYLFTWSYRELWRYTVRMLFLQFFQPSLFCNKLSTRWFVSTFGKFSLLEHLLFCPFQTSFFFYLLLC